MSDQGEQREPPLSIEDAPPADQQPQQLNVQDEQTLKFDKLGPVVVNNDGVRSFAAAPAHRRRSRASQTGTKWHP